jgi:hypothetical protein
MLRPHSDFSSDTPLLLLGHAYRELRCLQSCKQNTVSGIRAHVTSCGICGGQIGSGGGFFRLLRFPLPIFIPPTALHSSSISGANTIGQLVADVPSGLRLIPPQETKTKTKKKLSREGFKSNFEEDN